MSTSPAAAPEPEIRDLPLTHLIVVRETVPFDHLPSFYDRAYPTLFGALQRLGGAPAAPPMAVVHGNPTAAGLDLSVAVPIACSLAELGDPDDAAVSSETIPAARTATLLVRGDYSGIGPGYQRLHEWIVAAGETAGDISWEQYLTEPEPGGDPALNETLLGVPLRAQ
ncbi:GyrI-like domain-containing protein [Leucobacter musarum]|uniref:GyrI-like domain-containing protein n=1 Tax=Leucobacter musarum TaxID=1930747 RepID=UPI0006A79F3B|nr:GyrI-like domain-containing protein [Leucobacter musarum]